MKTTIEEINDEIYEGLLEDIRARRTIDETESLTREKAIERLKNFTQYRCSGVDLVALNMAIQALESQPRFLVHSDGEIEQIIEPCDDAVSRQAVLKINENHHGEMPNHINFEIWNEIKALPHVLPKCETMQVELEGDGYADGEIVYDSGKCPKCGWKFEDGDKDWEEPFCCHCGQRLHWFNETESED